MNTSYFPQKTQLISLKIEYELEIRYVTHIRFILHNMVEVLNMKQITLPHYVVVSR
jgi:hypothetical protein